MLYEWGELSYVEDTSAAEGPCYLWRVSQPVKAQN